jgi:hypothetical protein
MGIRLAGALGLAAAFIVTGCASSEQVLLTASTDQQAIMRNGVPALISNKKNVVMLRPNSRQMPTGSRPAFTIAVFNAGKHPITLQESDIRAEQSLGGRTASIRIFRYDELVKEEQDRQTAQTVIAVLGGVSGAIAASNAGYAKQSMVASRTAADFEAIKAQGEANLDNLQAVILKDHTVMPGEWYGGTVMLQSLNTPESGLSYAVAVSFGGEEHRFSVSQRPR